MENATVIIFVRHAEKEPSGHDPNLSHAGLQRANDLQYVLESTAIAAIYATPYKRTRQTVEPLSAKKGIAITEYNPTMPNKKLLDEIIAAHRGKTIVIAGHTNTIPEMLKTLTNNVFAIEIPESRYDNLFIATIAIDGATTVLPLKYGKPTP